MKFNFFVIDEGEERINVYAHSYYPWIDKVREIATEDETWVIGYKDDEIVKVYFHEIFCFAIENSKLYVYTEKEKYQIKERLYQIEERIDSDFIKINHSVIFKVNIIEKFKVSFGGALMVVMKNGFTDYISRRQIKSVKERMGIK